MNKRYNLQLVEVGSKEIVLEIELLHTTDPQNGDVYIDNPIHTTFVEIENAIEEDQKDA